ncbi:MAG: c-type cytochrome [Thermodesulfovibrionales bacterium]
MKKIIMLFSVLVVAVFLFASVATAKEKGKKGEALFKQHCSLCHPDGGNNVNPQKTLQKKDREANGVKAAADIVGKMRNPGTGMTKFDEQTLPAKDAKAIAEYILKTFK